MLKEPQPQKSSPNLMSHLILLLFSCLIHLCQAQPSPCQEVVDSSGSVYGLAAQQPGDSQVCQPGSSVFTRGGVRYCFGKTQGGTGGGVFTELKCGVKPSQPGPECKEPACQEFSKELIDSMDPSGQPCEDFYQFACGKDTGNDALTEQHKLFGSRMIALLKDPPNTNQDPWEQNLRCIQNKVGLLKWVDAGCFCAHILDISKLLFSFIFVQGILP